MYFRWRRTGEGAAELEALARELPKAEIEGALTLTKFDWSVAYRPVRDRCGRIAEADPGYRFIMMGTGERSRPHCGREP